MQAKQCPAARLQKPIHHSCVLPLLRLPLLPPPRPHVHALLGFSDGGRRYSLPHMSLLQGVAKAILEWCAFDPQTETASSRVGLNSSAVPEDAVLDWEPTCFTWKGLLLAFLLGCCFWPVVDLLTLVRVAWERGVRRSLGFLKKNLGDEPPAGHPRVLK